MTKAEFVKEVTDGLLPPPAYFPMNVKLNKEGYESIDKVMAKGLQALSPEAFEAAANETGAVMLDIRHQDEFAKSHIPGSIFIGLDGSFAPWVGDLIKDVAQTILLIGDENRIEEAITRLSRVGFDNTIGYLKGGFKSWIEASKETDTVETINATDLKSIVEDVPVFDVRKPGEYQSEHLPDAVHTSLSEINEHLSEYPENEKFYLHCAGGYRSIIAASILKSRGSHNLVDVQGGFKAIREAGLETTNYVCPSTL